MLFNSQRLSVVTLGLFSLVAAVHATYLAPISDKAVVECEPLKFTYSGTAPFTISVWPGCDDVDATDEPTTTYQTNFTSVTWTVNVASGKSIMFGVADANKNYDWSDDYTVQKGNSTACINKFTVWTPPSSNNATTTAPIGNAGEGPTSSSTPKSTSTAHIVGLTGGAVSSLSLHTEVAALAILGSIVATFAL
jgi:hypothetical protein